eukprot:CAMPEP_0180674948 /NCGR_PEP_ID=MMETSP1037_2-20121125/66500_1 /TAXON_ID=632150 /ORGANISM="Azadinium spinosum, Strain 3D9" /LENGTH=183 /DNA_ID=CAMNT_0022704317 /DNA_START=309 /DNA_END=856 /DNA_ORIENTATION=-
MYPGRWSQTALHASPSSAQVQGPKYAWRSPVEQHTPVATPRTAEPQPIASVAVVRAGATTPRMARSPSPSSYSLLPPTAVMLPTRAVPSAATSPREREAPTPGTPYSALGGRAMTPVVGGSSGSATVRRTVVCAARPTSVGAPGCIRNRHLTSKETAAVRQVRQLMSVRVTTALDCACEQEVA